MAVAGTAISAIGGMQQSAYMESQAKRQRQIAQQQAEYTRQVSERNAQIAEERAKYQAERLREQSVEKGAESQRRAIEERRQSRLARSRARAVSGASGASLYDPGFIKTMGALGAEGEYNALAQIYAGDEASGLLETQASLSEYEGRQAAERFRREGATQADLMEYEGRLRESESSALASAQRISSAGNIIKSSSSLYAKYAPDIYNPSTGSSGADSSYFPETGTTVYWD